MTYVVGCRKYRTPTPPPPPPSWIYLSLTWLKSMDVAACKQRQTGSLFWWVRGTVSLLIVRFLCSCTAAVFSDKQAFKNGTRQIFTPFVSYMVLRHLNNVHVSTKPGELLYSMVFDGVATEARKFVYAC